MYKSLMFKSNPLAEELNRYRQRHLCEPKTLISKNKKTNEKNKEKISEQPKFLNIGHKIVPKYPQYLLNKSLNQSPQTKKNISPQSNKKCTFKIHNHSLKNDNFVNRSISPDGMDKIKLIKRFSLNQKPENPSQLQFPKNYKEKIQTNEYMQYSLNPSQERKNNISFNQVKNEPHMSFRETKKSQQAKTMTTQNQLKSTLYQSIDLGNIFQKIESKIDLSKAKHLNDNTCPQKDTLKGKKQNKDNDRNSKQVKMIEKLKSQLTSQTAKKTSQIMNQFNLKSLIEKKLNNQRYPSPLTPQPEPLTARDPFFPKPTEIDTLINSLNFNDSASKCWMPSTRKRSSVIVIDEKGNIIEDEQVNKLKKHRQSNMKISSNLAKRRNFIETQQMSEMK